MKHKILFVDDEENILLSLKRIFRTSDYEGQYVSSGKEGLAFLKENPVSVIISDMKMPEMNGVEFLQEAMKICPDAVRIILSGHAEAGNIMDAINRGSIWHFISKPWDNDDLRITIRNAVDLYDRNQERIELIETLDKMNKELEKKVEERTWLINERTNLLNMLVEDASINDILNRACHTISQYLGEKKVILKTLFTESIYSSLEKAPQNLPPLYLELEKEVNGSEKYGCREGILAIPLEKSGSLLGILFMETDCTHSTETINSISGFISLLNITLFQYKSLESTPKLLEDIDKLIGSI
ncbi:MAG: response regulator [Spirochaetales bacterium]|nr:response regulator [Spirochaetales bacterium]